MLKTIQCDKFIENDQIRPPIVFKAGLNTILGDEYASNSIGKSTFLMILDFVFGGDDYVRKSIDVQAHIGPHHIEFSFEFEDGMHYFSRSTDNFSIIHVCNANYQVEKKISKDTYTTFLSQKFNLDLPDLTLRNAIGRFFRIYGRETLDPKYPLQQAIREPQQMGIDALLKLFDRYEAVKRQKEVTAEAVLKEKTFKSAQRYHYLPSVSNKIQYTKNEKRILELEAEIKRLIKESTHGFSQLETLQTESTLELQQQLKVEKRHYINLINELNTMENRPHKQNAFQKDYDKLQSFFPGIDMRKLEDIERFHHKMGQILKNEFKEKTASLQSMINLSAERIAQLELKITEIGNAPHLTQVVLTKHYQKQKERTQLQAANKSYDTLETLKRETKLLKQLLDELTLEIISQTETDINAVMNSLNKHMSNSKTAPHLTIRDANRYTFSTPNDRGTGSEYKGLILFDLVVLALTSLPLLVHDSVLLKQIEDRTLEAILRLYTQTQKQVFIVLDKQSSFSKDMQSILEKTEVLRLFSGGGELFGTAWNKNTR
ncbi:MAG: DUF2326 domain-containing protein [Defluviitaleaceae bacterium]|nr:DUF2326 domain-containing protein [Defluviitaleaceae bacterium]